MDNANANCNNLPENNHMDACELTLCYGCKKPIEDHYRLRVSPDMEWHTGCLACSECQRYLDETCTCFMRDGRPYCRRDYVRLFGIKCSLCSEHISATDLVMRAKSQVFHLNCFRCSACENKLVPGEQFALSNGKLYCKMDFESLRLDTIESPTGMASEAGHSDLTSVCIAPEGSYTSSVSVPDPPGGVYGLSLASGMPKLGPSQSQVSSADIGTPPGDENGQISTVHSHPPSSSSPTSSSEGGQVANANAPSGSSRTKRSNSEKGPRVRTVLSEQQLQTLRTVYASNPRPDALLKEHLVEITGLSPRVIRVWFQNKRCKDKKKAIQAEAMRLQQQQGVQKVMPPLTPQTPLTPDSMGQISPRHGISAFTYPTVPASYDLPTTPTPPGVSPIVTYHQNPAWGSPTETTMSPFEAGGEFSSPMTTEHQQAFVYSSASTQPSQFAF